jgi:predicted methyltransferase
MKLRFIWALAGLSGIWAPCIGATAEEAPAIPAGVIAAVADIRRPVEQIRLDATRKPALVIAFAQVKPGDLVADFMPGNAYFTRILSDVVGSSGHVYAFIPTEQVANCASQEIAGTQAIAHDTSYGNVTVLSDSLANFRIPESLDVLWTAQNYHDLHDSFMGPADLGALNKVFFNALKPGGVFLVIDHVAELGSGLRDTETLHRIDPIRMQREIEAAGFVLEAQSNVLRNADDNHKRAVFDPLIRGKTDQVVLRFRKPSTITPTSWQSLPAPPSPGPQQSWPAEIRPLR